MPLTRCTLATTTGRIEFVILRTDCSLSVALHLLLQKRSYCQLMGSDQPMMGLAPFQSNALTGALVRSRRERKTGSRREPPTLAGIRVIAAPVLDRPLRPRFQEHTLREQRRALSNAMRCVDREHSIHSNQVLAVGPAVLKNEHSASGRDLSAFQHPPGIGVVHRPNGPAVCQPGATPRVQSTTVQKSPKWGGPNLGTSR